MWVPWQRRCRFGGYFECLVGVAPCALAVSETRRNARASDQVTQNQIAEHRGPLNFLAALVEALVGFSQAVGIAAAQQHLGESEVEISSASKPPRGVAIATFDKVSRQGLRVLVMVVSAQRFGKILGGPDRLKLIFAVVVDHSLQEFTSRLPRRSIRLGDQVHTLYSDVLWATGRAGATQLRFEGLRDGLVPGGRAVPIGVIVLQAHADIVHRRVQTNAVRKRVTQRPGNDRKPTPELCRLSAVWETLTMTARSRPGLAVAGLLSVLVLAGCSSGNGYPILDRGAEAADAVPNTLPDYAGNNADLSSSRFVGEHDGTSLWLMKGNDPATVCLLAYPDADGWVIGCSDMAGQSGVGGPGTQYVYQPDFAPAPEDSIEISANVYVPNQS